MTEPRRGRPPHRFAIRRVRLVNFHNLVDETIEIPEAGHLFLLGDNGSGKTTVLDAIHLALTGSLEVELNAAARIAGGRDAGRSLQGIVLRYDTERGVVNAGGAIAYVLLELFDETEGAVLCAGVGIEATTMDADVTRWAVLHRGPLEAIPLLEDGPEGKLPATRESLRTALGKADVPARMSEYRKLLAERLFGGETLYEEVCRFWKMAKAYREIVAGARDFAGLFFRLLPAPDAQVFSDILRSLRALDELDGLVEQLERQRRYVSDVTALVEEIRMRREEIARYRWLVTFRRRGDLRETLKHARDRASQGQRNLEQLAAEVAVREGAVAVAREALRAADAQDPDGLLGRLRAAGAQLERGEGEMRSAAASSRTLDAGLAECARLARDAFDRRSRCWSSRIAGLAAAVDSVRSLEHPLGALLALVDSEREQAGGVLAPGAPAPLPEIEPEATEQAVRSVATAQARAELCRSELARHSYALDRVRDEVARLSARTEETPSIAGFVQARVALADANLDAKPLFELLDPQPGASEGDLGTIEALLGDAGLATFVVAPEQVAAVRARALPHDGVRVVARVADDVLLTPWIAELFSSRTPSQALRVLATLLSQAQSLGSIAPPDALGDVEHRGAATRSAALRPRLIGAEARRRAHQERLRAARGALLAAETVQAAAEAERDAAERSHRSATAAVTALAALRDRELLEAHAALEHRLIESGHAALRAQEARERLDDATRLRDELSQDVAALQTRVRGAGIAELEQHLARLRKREHDAVNAERAAVASQLKLDAELSSLRAEIGVRDGELGRLDSELSLRALALRVALGKAEDELDDVLLERYVRVEKRGDQFRSVETIDAATGEAERQEAAACREIAGDGSRGTSSLEWAGRFGFAWSSEELRVEDRRGEPLVSVVAELEKRIAEQREVVNERTRELMDKLVMGDLARELQEQVERLHKTVREMNGLLDGLRFGTTRYQFKVTPRSDTVELVGLVRKLSLLDQSSRGRFREFIDARLEEMRRLDRDAEVPELLDYRRWFEYQLSMRSSGQGDTELTRELRALGSGGEQGVPNYLLVLALAKLMFDNAGARVRPLLFDEAFYGIDAGRRDQLLRFATELGLQVVVASPDQDGVSPSARRTTTLFLVKDEHGDVHLAPYHYWNDTAVAQAVLFRERALEPDPEQAICTIAEGVPAAAATTDDG